MIGAGLEVLGGDVVLEQRVGLTLAVSLREIQEFSRLLILCTSGSTRSCHQRTRLGM